MITRQNAEISGQGKGHKPVDSHTGGLEEYRGICAQLLRHVHTGFSGHALRPLPFFIYD